MSVDWPPWTPAGVIVTWTAVMGIGATGRLLRLLLERIESNVEVRRCVLYTARTLAIMMSPLS